MMDLVQEAFTRLWPERAFPYTAEITYSGRFSPYNARVRLARNHLQFGLSAEWKRVDREIVIGLVQSLLARTLKEKGATVNVQLYHAFVRKLPDAIPRGASDPVLEQAFARLNELYFYSLLDQPTLAWGTASTTKLGHYNLHTDTVVLSAVFREAPRELLEYVLYHEMLHKKHKYRQQGNRSHFHTKAFKADEKRFNDAGRLERQLEGFLGTQRRAARRRGFQKRSFFSRWL